MKLIYCYIENFRGINNLKLNLSSTHDVTTEVVNEKIHFVLANLKFPKVDANICPYSDRYNDQSDLI